MLPINKDSSSLFGYPGFGNQTLQLNVHESNLFAPIAAPIAAPQPTQPVQIQVGERLITYPNVGESLNGYKLKEVLGTGISGAAYIVRDSLGHDDVMKINVKEKEDDSSFERELEVLEQVKGQSGFPQLRDNFSIGNQRCLVMSKSGATASKVFPAGACSTENVLRLGFHLIHLVQKMHNLGFYHRDVHANNVMLQVNDQGVLEINLIDFGTSRRIQDIHKADECGLRTWFASRNVYNYSTFQKVDDFISVVFLLVSRFGMDPFGADKELWEERKEQLHKDPYAVFVDEKRWLADLYCILECQRGYDFQLEQVMDVLRNAIPGFDVSSNLEFYTEGGNIFCE